MAIFIKIFITIMCMSIILSIAFPGEETQFLNGGFFTQLLKTNPINETEYTGFNPNISLEWSEGGNKESSFLRQFIDGLSVIKSFVITLINIAVLPITIAIRFQMPVIIKLMIFIPLAILYIVSATLIIVRGVQP